MIIAVASGKGGTGKTTVAVNLAWCAAEPLLLLDCDVEEPNCHIFLERRVRECKIVHMPTPELDAEKCTGCGQCARICEFNSIAMVGGRPIIFPELCHGCGGCIWVCEAGALTEVGRKIGVVELSETEVGTFVQGRLDVGRALSPPLINAVKATAPHSRVTIVDSPPGTACPAAAALKGCDFAILVAEPTPFGAHDLGLVVDSVRELGIPFGVVINKARGTSDPARDYCERQGFSILGEIPESRQLARSYARGSIAARSLPETRPIFQELWATILALDPSRGPRTAAGRAGVFREVLPGRS